jgi:hypothetical protein
MKISFLASVIVSSRHDTNAGCELRMGAAARTSPMDKPELANIWMCCQLENDQKISYVMQDTLLTKPIVRYR